MSEFKGFPEEIIGFFEQLKRNNNREWFEDHRKDYEDYVLGPSREFVVCMGDMLKQLSPAIRAIPKINHSLFRINRDTRFSKDKSPYKTHLGVWFWEGERKRMECSGFYFHLEEETVLLGTGIYRFSKEVLDIYRSAVAERKRGDKLKKIIGNITGKGYSIGGRHYKRLPHGYEASRKNSELLLHNGLYSMIELKASKKLLSETLITRVFSCFEDMLPLHLWLCESLF